MLAAKLGLAHAKQWPLTLEDYDGKDGPFDIILLHNAINHLDEAACIHLHEGGAYRARYAAIAAKVAALAAPGGTLILSDCARRNFFPDVLGTPSPFARIIEWNKHQQPELWAQLFSSAGFARPKIRWASPNRLGAVGMPLRVRAIQYFLTSYFVLTMTRASKSP